MANYYGITRTNYFAVTDPEQLKAFIEKVVGAESEVELFDRDFDGITKYGFGCYSTIFGYETTDEDGEPDYDYDAFVHDLQGILVPGEAIVITEVGNEKLRYLYAASQIITKECVGTVDIYNAVCEKLCEIVGDNSFQTTFDY